jgi:hypothetical protein
MQGASVQVSAGVSVFAKAVLEITSTGEMTRLRRRKSRKIRSLDFIMIQVISSNQIVINWF